MLRAADKGLRPESGQPETATIILNIDLSFVCPPAVLGLLWWNIMLSNNPPVRSRKHAAAARNRHLRLITDVAVSPADLHRAPLSVVYTPTSQLRAPGRKLLRCSKRHLTGLKVSIEKFGMLRPVGVDKDCTIIAGVAVWLVA